MLFRNYDICCLFAYCMMLLTTIIMLHDPVDDTREGNWPVVFCTVALSFLKDR